MRIVAYGSAGDPCKVGPNSGNRPVPKREILQNIAELPAAETSDDIEEQLTTMHHELTKLPIVEREALTLFYLRELSLEEIADVLAVPVGTVKSRLFRARKMLRLELKSKGEHS